MTDQTRGIGNIQLLRLLLGFAAAQGYWAGVVSKFESEPSR
jgi:hypothetical protein